MYGVLCIFTAVRLDAGIALKSVQCSKMSAHILRMFAIICSIRCQNIKPPRRQERQV